VIEIILSVLPWILLIVWLLCAIVHLFLPLFHGESLTLRTSPEEEVEIHVSVKADGMQIEILTLQETETDKTRCPENLSGTQQQNTKR